MFNKRWMPDHANASQGSFMVGAIRSAQDN